MDQSARPFRSVLYIPGSNSRALEKAKTLPVDAIIFDLEDAVSVESKADARTMLAETLSAGGFGQRTQIVRVNGLDTDWGQPDLEAVTAIGPQAILLPKVGSAAMIEELARRLDRSPQCADTKIWAMIETPQGVLNAAEIAAAPRMGGFVLGTNDLAKELNTKYRADRQPLMTALQMCLLGARAAGIIAIDGVYNAFKDVDGLRLEAEQGRDMGFDGKSLIHPAQVSIANEVFSPAAEDVELAQRQIAAFEEAVADGKGVAVVDGRIVENLHVATARQTLAKANAIAVLASEAA